MKQIKDDYAVQQGFANWYGLITYCNEKYLDHYITEVMILAQKQGYGQQQHVYYGSSVNGIITAVDKDGIPF